MHTIFNSDLSTTIMLLLSQLNRLVKARLVETYTKTPDYREQEIAAKAKDKVDFKMWE
jgi:hypothetical protein